MAKFRQKIQSLENYKVFNQYLPDDHSRPQQLQRYVEQAAHVFENKPSVLDLGCGEGHSYELFKQALPASEWHGVDIEDSPEVRKRVGTNATMRSFDGINLPYEDAGFDLIYCNQVLEHVRYPDALVGEAFRVLKPGGVFAGSVSYLEPYHSYSIFNFTPYGIIKVFTDAGFALEQIRPGTDASLLINRLMFNRSRKTRFLWNRNYLHGVVDLIGRLTGLGHRERNFLKVQFSGHLFFTARRPTDTADAPV